EGREMDRDRAGLGERGAVGGEQARRSVEALLDDGREGTAKQRRLHLVGDAVELVANDLGGDGVEGFGLSLGCHGSFPQSAVMIRVPSATTVARQPGSIRVVVSGCSTIAGPRISRPIAIVDRSYTLAGMNRPLSAVRMSRWLLCALSLSGRASGGVDALPTA